MTYEIAIGPCTATEHNTKPVYHTGHPVIFPVLSSVVVVPLNHRLARDKMIRRTVYAEDVLSH